MTYLYILCFALTFSIFTQSVTFLNRKPFNCVFCLSFWVTLITESVSTNELLIPIGIASTMALLGSIFEKVFNKIILSLMK